MPSFLFCLILNEKGYSYTKAASLLFLENRKILYLLFIILGNTNCCING